MNQPMNNVRLDFLKQQAREIEAEQDKLLECKDGESWTEEDVLSYLAHSTKLAAKYKSILTLSGVL
ncbi:hypothetical protein [Ruegeria arenilitoris]|uniref:hypothetical protein n=1 Tax=Ruegeria arenilitoris TaxID=1173585 RepID=UPI00147BEDAA|nr:hypothetical protein [Ruegeria arenilitoris]